MVTKIKNIRMCNVHELFWCFSATVSTIYCFHPKFRLFVARNWILLYIEKNAKRCAQMSRSSYYRFTFLGLSFGHLVQNIQIVNVLWISTHQTLLRGKTRWFQGLFMVSGSKHLSSTNNHNKSLDFFCSCAGGMEICKSDSTLLGMVSKTINWGGSRTILRVDVNLLFMAAHSLHSADKIWRPTRVHAWSHFAFNFYQWLAQLVYLSHRSYFTRTMLSFTTLTPVSETYISTVFNKDLKTVAVLDPL